MKKSKFIFSLLALLVLSCNNDDSSSTDTDTDTDTDTSTTITVDCDDITTVTENVVCLAKTFMESLSTAEQATVLVDYSQTNVIKWSNLPCGADCRNGLQLGDLTSAQQELALDIIAAATSSDSNSGLDQFEQVRLADDYLKDVGGRSGYSSDIYFIAFLGTPSTTSSWELAYGGHHFAGNITFNGEDIPSSGTPAFLGVEPTSFTVDGTTYTPMDGEHSAMLAMMESFSASELASAKISGTFTDVLLGPNEDGNFPSSKSGIQASALSSAQQALIMDAIASYVGDLESTTAESLLDIYESELDDTYIGYSGSIDLDAQGDYIRIDGPSVWIEFVCQNGVVFSGIHYHSVWRDHTRDYGGNFFQ